MEKPTIAAQLKTMMIIYGALLMGLAFGTFILFPEMESYNATFDEDNIMVYVVPAMLFAAIFLGDLLFKKTINEAKEKELPAKVMTYQTAMLMRLAPLEGVAFFSLIQLGQTSNALFLYVLSVAMAYMLYLAPTRARISKELQLNNSEQREFNR
jgi:hypothetical protein